MAAGSNANEIRFRRVYDAPVGAVWDAWTIPEQVEQWWGRRGFSALPHSSAASGVTLIFRFASMTSAVMTMAKPLDGEIVF